MIQYRNNQSTLAELDVFLTSSFSSCTRELISFKTAIPFRLFINQLKLICTIPDWFVNKLIDEIKQKKDVLTEMGVISVTIESNTLLVDKKVCQIISSVNPQIHNQILMIIVQLNVHITIKTVVEHMCNCG